MKDKHLKIKFPGREWITWKSYKTWDAAYDAFKSFKYGLGNWTAFICKDGSSHIIYYGDAEYRISGPGGNSIIK